MSGRVAFVNFFGRAVGGARHGMPFEFEPIGVVNQAVKDGIGKCGLVDDVVPSCNRKLAGDQDRSSSIAVLDDFHEVTALPGVQAIGPPIIENEQVRFHEGSEQAGKATVAMGEFEVGEEPRYPLVDDGEVVAAGPLAQSAGEPGLPDTAGAGDHQIAGVCDPAPGGELLEQSPVQFAWRAKVDIFDGRPDVAQLCRPHAGLEPPRIAAGDLAVDQQPEPFVVAQIGSGVLRLQVVESLGHTVEFQLAQLFQGWVGQHCLSFQWKYPEPRILPCWIAGPSAAGSGALRWRLFFRMELTDE